MYFLTLCCTPRGLNQLCHPGLAAELHRSILYRVALGHWWLQIVTLMPDHLHMLVAFGADPGMQRVMSDWKRYTTLRLGVSWQRDFFEHRLRRDESYKEKATYVLQNPVRAGLVKRAEDWPYTWVMTT